MTQVLDQFSDQFALQGNFDPNLLFQDISTLENQLRVWFQSIKALDPQKRRGWICGLGHGIMPGTPEASVSLFVSLQREYFS